MAAEKRSGTPGFAPVYTASSRVLILGSYPSPKSFEYGFYYGHPQNRFWPLIARLFGTPPPQTISEKTALIKANKLALWDALESCTIIGAADASIENPVPNDIAGLIAKTNVNAVFCNGAASHKYYTKFCEKAAGIPAVRLPSTSPANAACGFERLLDEWRVVAEL